MSDSNKGLTSADRVLKLMSLIPQSEPGITLKQLHKQLSDMGFDAKLRTLYRDLKKIKDTNQEYRLVSSSKGRTEASYHFERRLRTSSYKAPRRKSRDSLYINRPLDFTKNDQSESIKEKRIFGYKEIAFRIEFVSDIQSELEGEGSSYFSYYEIENYRDRRFIIFNAAPGEELCQWIFSLGDKVVVHEPFFLRERIEKSVARMMKHYSAEFDGLKENSQ